MSIDVGKETSRSEEAIQSSDIDRFAPFGKVQAVDCLDSDGQPPVLWEFPSTKEVKADLVEPVAGVP